MNINNDAVTASPNSSTPINDTYKVTTGLDTCLPFEIECWSEGGTIYCRARPFIASSELGWCLFTTSTGGELTRLHTMHKWMTGRSGCQRKGFREAMENKTHLLHESEGKVKIECFSMKEVKS